MQPSYGAGRFPAPIAARARSRLVASPPRFNRNNRPTRGAS
jgi:hypothetical protein